VAGVSNCFHSMACREKRKLQCISSALRKAGKCALRTCLIGCSAPTICVSNTAELSGSGQLQCTRGDLVKNESVPTSASHGTLFRTGYWLPTVLSEDCYPNCARSPIDVLSHSTTDDSLSSNAPVRHSDLAAGRRLRGCDRLCHGSPCPVLLPPFRLHVDTSLCHRRARGVLPRIAKAPPPLQSPLLFFQIVDTRKFLLNAERERCWKENHQWWNFSMAATITRKIL